MGCPPPWPPLFTWKTVSETPGTFRLALGRCGHPCPGLYLPEGACDTPSPAELERLAETSQSPGAPTW